MGCQMNKMLIEDQIVILSIQLKETSKLKAMVSCDRDKFILQLLGQIQKLSRKSKNHTLEAYALEEYQTATDGIYGTYGEGIDLALRETSDLLISKTKATHDCGSESKDVDDSKLKLFNKENGSHYRNDSLPTFTSLDGHTDSSEDYGFFAD